MPELVSTAEAVAVVRYVLGEDTNDVAAEYLTRLTHAELIHLALVLAALVGAARDVAPGMALEDWLGQVAASPA